MDDAATRAYEDGKKPGQCWKCNGAGTVQSRPRKRDFKGSGKKGPRPVSQTTCNVCDGSGKLTRSAPSSAKGAPASKRARVHATSATKRGWIEPGPKTAGQDLVWREGQYLYGEWCGFAGRWRLLQPLKRHRYSTDDVVTAWVAWREAHRLGMHEIKHADIGCGIGSVLLFVSWLLPGASCIGVEAQFSRARLARRSAAFNLGMLERSKETGSAVSTDGAAGGGGGKYGQGGLEHSGLTSNMTGDMTSSSSAPSSSSPLALPGIAPAGQHPPPGADTAEISIPEGLSQRLDSATAFGAAAGRPSSPRVQVRHGDLRDGAKVLPEGAAFHIVTGTPPYFLPNAGGAPADAESAACLFEARGGIEAYCEAAKRLLLRPPFPGAESTHGSRPGQSSSTSASGTPDAPIAAAGGGGAAPIAEGVSPGASIGALATSGAAVEIGAEDPPASGWPDRYPPVPLLASQVPPASADKTGIGAKSGPPSSISSSSSSAAVGPGDARPSPGAAVEITGSTHAIKHGTADAPRMLQKEAWEGGGRFVVCETALEGARVYHAAAASGLSVTRRVDVVPKEGKNTLFQVFVMASAYKGAAAGEAVEYEVAAAAGGGGGGGGSAGSATHETSSPATPPSTGSDRLPAKGRVDWSVFGEPVEVVTVRDGKGDRTDQYKRLLRDIGKPPF